MKKVFLVIFVFCARVVFSQTPEQIQRSQQQLIDAGFRRQELERAITKPVTQQPQQQEETAPQKSSHCVQINSIEFDGNTKLSSGEINKLAKPFLNKCLTVDEINKLLNTITNAYIDKEFNFGFVNLATTFDGQYSRDELFSSDGFYIGSEASVRGFSNDGITGGQRFLHKERFEV
ncbi:hypothetical protein HDR60_01040 [bacterium]|nr:hypothetical protein [bacterium]